MDRLDQFTDGRNRWAHADRKPAGSARIEIGEARQLFSAGIDLLRWLHEAVLPTVPDGRATGDRRARERVILEDARPARHMIFISHSSQDAQTASKIAHGLHALDYSVFYADWAIAPGQSIVGKINEALMQSDTLLVLLSRSSVASPWVEREFTAALMDQLGGQDVTVVPVLIEQCDVPAVLRDIKHIDMTRGNFEIGIGELMRFLGQRRRRHQPEEG